MPDTNAVCQTVHAKGNSGGVPSQSSFRQETWFDLAPDAVMVVRDGLVERLNPAALDLFGAAHGQFLLGTAIENRVAENARPEFTAKLGRPGLLGARISPFNVTMCRLDGRNVEVALSASAVNDERGPAWLMFLREAIANESAERDDRTRLRHLETFVSEAPTAVAMTDRNLLVVAVSRRWFQEMHHPEVDIRGCRLLEPFAERSLQWRDIQIRITGGAEEVWEEEIQFPSDGQVEVLRWEVRPWLDVENGVGGFLLAVRAVTSRKRVELAAREGAEELQRLLDVVPAAVWVARDPQCLEIVGNQAANRLFEAARNENISASAVPFARAHFTPDGRALAPSELPMQVAAATNREVRDVEVHVRLASGRKLALLGSAVPLRDACGEVRGCIAAFMDISVRMQAEQALLESEQRYRTLFEASRDGIAMLTLDGRIAHANPSYQAMLGYSLDELRSLRPRQWSPPHWHAIEDAIRNERILTHGDSGEYAIEYIRREGSVFPVSLRAWPVRDAQGQFQAVCVIARDITERTRAAESLRESEERFRALAELSPDAILVHVDAHYTYANSAAVRLLAAGSAADLIGYPVLQVIPPEYRAMVLERIRVMNELRDPVPLVDYSWRRLDGALINVEVAASPIFWEGRRAIQVVARDVTARKAADRALRASEERFRSVFEFSSVGKLEADPATGKFLRVNEAYCRLTGYTKAELLTRTLLDIGQTGDGAAGLDLRKLRVRRKQPSYEREMRYLRPDGEVVWAQVTLNLLAASSSQPARLIGVVQDITPRKLVQQQLEAALADKTALLNEVHHRVKNNLQVISSLLELQGSFNADPAVRSVLGDSRNRVRAMALIHQLLYQEGDFSRIDLGAYLMELTNLLRAVHGDRRHQVALLVEAASKPVFLDLHRAIPCALLVNEVVTNSFKHAFPDNRPGEIVIRLTSQSDGEILMSICDDGIGLRGDEFVQAESSLGLQLIPLFVEQIDGQWEWERESGFGIQVRFKALDASP